MFMFNDFHYYTTQQPIIMAIVTRFTPQQTKLISIASDLIELSKTVVEANPRLIMLVVMPDDTDRSDQRIIVSACSVLMLIFEEVRTYMQNKNNDREMAHELYNTLIDKYGKFNGFLYDRIIKPQFTSVSDVLNLHTTKYDDVWYASICLHHSDWISRFTCDTFIFRSERFQSNYGFDTLAWQNLVRRCNEHAKTRLSSYKVRYFVRAYFFLALDCSPPVVEAVDVTLFHLTKN